jgi:predicted SnoaL-like aldol condensation-catalyzing enzyme
VGILALPESKGFRMNTAHSNKKLTHKDMAISFLHLVTSGNVREAYAQHVGPTFRHHNPYFKGDAESLMSGMEENDAKFPNKLFEVQHALEDDDHVAIHSHVRLKPDERGFAAVHIFRFHNDRIVELWDVVQPVPEESPNEYGMF